MKFASTLFVACCLLTSSLAAQQPGSTRHTEGLRENTPNAFVLKAGKVVTRPGTVIDNGVIVVRDGRIVSVRGADDWPADHRIIDLSDKTVYAGFIDGYSEQEIVISSEAPEHARYWNANIRPERDMGEMFAWDEGATDELRDNGITAVLVSPGTGIFKGQTALVLTSETNPEQAILAREVAQAAELTVQRRFGGPRIYPSSPMGAVALARQAMLDAQWYRDAWEVATDQPDLNRPEVNDSLAALAKVIAGQQPLLVDTSNELMVLRAKRFADEFDAQLMIVGNGNEYRRLEHVAKLDVPLILPVNFPSPPAVATPEDAMNVTLESLMHWDLAPENPAKLAEAGVDFAFTSKGLDSSSDFLKRIRHAVTRGLDADTALSALTVNPAGYFGVSDQVGSIETGKLANFVITDGDLFDDDTKIVETWVAGERHVIEQPPMRLVAGTWQIDTDTEQTFTIKIRGSGGSLSGDVDLASGETSPGDSGPSSNQEDGEEEGDEEEDDEEDTEKETLSAKSLVLVGTRLSGSFKSDELDEPGLAQFSLIVDADNESASGYLIWPNGKRQLLTATMTERATEEDDDESASEGDRPRRGRGMRGRRGGRRFAGRRGGGPGGGSGGGGSSNEAAEYSKEPSTYEANYPLGAYGVAELPEAETVRFDNVTVWTNGDDGVLENAAVLMVDGKIAGVYREGED
ncbi:MAG: amidohydrolase family protein, partial [Pirellulaceae bacterium]